MEPEAVFLGFLNIGSPFSFLSLFKVLKLSIGKITSPLISNFSGYDPFKIKGIFFIVLIFDVTLSPLIPSPLVSALFNFPFS